MAYPTKVPIANGPDVAVGIENPQRGVKLAHAHEEVPQGRRGEGSPLTGFGVELPQSIRIQQPYMLHILAKGNRDRRRTAGHRVGLHLFGLGIHNLDLWSSVKRRVN